MADRESAIASEGQKAAMHTVTRRVEGASAMPPTIAFARMQAGRRVLVGPSDILSLQRTVGNRAVQRMVTGGKKGGKKKSSNADGASEKTNNKLAQHNEEDQYVLDFWESEDAISVDYNTMYGYFVSKPHLIPFYVHGKIKRRLEERINDDLIYASASDTEGEITQDTIDVANDILELIEIIDKSNAISKPSEKQETERNTALANITQLTSTKAKQLRSIMIEDKDLLSYITYMNINHPDECNNIFATFIKPKIQSFIGTIPAIHKIVKLLNDKGVKIKI